MNPLLIYLFKSAFSLLILYLAYALSSRRQSYFHFNRFFLLASVLVSALLPLFSFQFNQILHTAPLLGSNILISDTLLHYNLEEVIISASAEPGFFIRSLSIFQIVTIIYLAGVCIKGLHFMMRILQLHFLKNRSHILHNGGIQFVFTRAGSPTFSFFNWIFIDPNLYNKTDAAQILAHEKVHLRQLHSFDIVLAELLCIIQWFNPIAYFLAKSIKENHEFIADEDVVNSYQDPTAYRLLLMEYATNMKINSITHNFSYSLLKRRLHMIKKPKSLAGLTIGLAGLAVALNLVFFACSSPNTDLTQGTESTKLGEVYSSVEVMPSYPGGLDSLVQFLSSNIVYPAEAKEQGIEGKVMVEFVVGSDGSIQDVMIQKGIGYGCDKEAKRVVESMPLWNPGEKDGKNVRVQFVLPIQFSLDGEKTADTTVFTVVEQMPKYPGGEKAMLSYLSNNITYPATAKKEGIQGRVFVNFIIEKDGRVSEVKILRGIGGGCDEEALRVVSSMPDWEPGMQSGKAVRVSFNLPIKFKLN